MAEITKEVFNEGRAELVARALLGTFHSTKLDQCLPAGLVWRHAGSQILLGLAIDVESNLLFETALEFVTPAEPTEPAPALHHSTHHAPALLRVASSTRLIARDMRRHCASSSFKWRRPLAVSE